MNYSKTIDQRLSHRENLLADYHQDLIKAEAIREQLQNKLNDAIAANDFKKAAHIERDIAINQLDIDGANRAIALASERMRLGQDFIKGEWFEKQTELSVDVTKAKVAADKAFEIFKKALESVTAAQKVGSVEAHKWELLLRAENPEIPSPMPIISIGDIINPRGLYEKYKGKF